MRRGVQAVRACVPQYGCLNFYDPRLIGEIMKNATSRTVQALCLGFVITFGSLSVVQAQTKPAATTPAEMSKPMAGPGDMKQSMTMGMDSMQKMPMSGDIDKDFAMMMKIHHQGALDMAQMELAQGKSPEMKAMAKQIIASQKKEIAQFDKWLAKQK